MKLLFDHNLSHKLVRRLADVFPGSEHVRNLDLHRADDAEVWEVAIAFGWTTLVAVEMVAAKAGIGVMVLNAARFLATDIVFLGIVVIGAVAFVFDLMMRKIERALVPWKGKV